MKTCTCGKVFDEKASHYRAFDLQKGYEEKFFCGQECLKGWLRRKKIGMWGTLLLGVIICAVLFSEGETTLAFGLLFLPYTIRQLKSMLGGSGEFLSIMLVLLSTITVVYPAYKFVQEFLEYRRIKARNNL